MAATALHTEALSRLIALELDDAPLAVGIVLTLANEDPRYERPAAYGWLAEQIGTKKTGAKGMVADTIVTALRELEQAGFLAERASRQAVHGHEGAGTPYFIAVAEWEGEPQQLPAWQHATASLQRVRELAPGSAILAAYARLAWAVDATGQLERTQSGLATELRVSRKTADRVTAQIAAADLLFYEIAEQERVGAPKTYHLQLRSLAEAKAATAEQAPEQPVTSKQDLAATKAARVAARFARKLGDLWYPELVMKLIANEEGKLPVGETFDLETKERKFVNVVLKAQKDHPSGPGQLLVKYALEQTKARPYVKTPASYFRSIVDKSAVDFLARPKLGMTNAEAAHERSPERSREIVRDVLADLAEGINRGVVSVPTIAEAEAKLKKDAGTHLAVLVKEIYEGDTALARAHLLEAVKQGATNPIAEPLTFYGLDFLPEFSWPEDVDSLKTRMAGAEAAEAERQWLESDAAKLYAAREVGA